MGDKLTYIDVLQKARLDLLLNSFNGALDVIASRIGPASKDKNIYTVLQDINSSIQSGFAAVAAEIAKLQTPEPPPAQTKGIIVAKFKVAADNPDIQIDLSGSGFTDSEGNATGAGDIDLSVESSNPDSVGATLSDQALSDDGQSVSAKLAVHFGGPSSDVAVLTYRATNRDTGQVVAAGTDEFTVQVGEAGLGTITSSVPLTPEPEV